MLAEFSWSGAMGGSPIFLVLIGCSAVTLGVALERVIYFWRRRGNPSATLARALEHARKGEIREAVWICEASPHPMGPVAKQLLEGGDLHGQAAEERIQVALSEQKLLLERNLGILGTMAAVAPLIGLLGTVWGIMRAFQDMARIGSAAPSVVAAGVAEALVTTAAGLVVAVPAIMLYNHLVRRLNTMLTEAENHCRTLRSMLTDCGSTEDVAFMREAAAGVNTQERQVPEWHDQRQPAPRNPSAVGVR